MDQQQEHVFLALRDLMRIFATKEALISFCKGNHSLSLVDVDSTLFVAYDAAVADWEVTRKAAFSALDALLQAVPYFE